MSTPPKIGIIICSTRQPRVCPQIAQFVLDTIKSKQSTQPQPDTTTTTILFPTPSLNLIDLSTWALPFFNESTIPRQITSPSQYDHEHTRAWSAEITSYSAFIFVVPQYNWGYPAVVKNAIDYLYHEWSGKPAFVVSYGGHGGGKCNRQLREVLEGVNMVVDAGGAGGVELRFPGREVLGKAARGEDIGLNKEEVVFWKEEAVAIGVAYEGLLRVLVEGQAKV
jgi:NAD(P)H-dependent FMN reductase